MSKLYGIEKEDRIFYFTKSALDKEIKRIAAKAGLPPIRVHDLRHPYVKPMTKNNSSIITEFFTDSPSSLFAIRTRKVLLAL